MVERDEMASEPPAVGSGRGVAGRVLLVALTVWALALILPGFYHVVDPLASFGLAIDNDGVVIDTRDPFASEAESPAARAGIARGDRIDLRAMRCVPLQAPTCADVLVLLGGLGGPHYVLPGSSIELVILPRGGGAARAVRLEATRAAWYGLDSLVLLACTVVGVAVVLIAFLLVWQRPGAMTWGFFLYAIWFNPGQTYTSYALLTPWPFAVLAEELVEAAAQAAAYVGLVVFALRFPHDATEPGWRPLECALPLLGVALVVLNLLSFANVFGYPTETLARATFYAGFAVDALVLLVLLRHRRQLAPQDDQRMRWVIAGCVVGLPAYLVAALCQSAGLFDDVWEGSGPPQAFVGLLYLLNGVLAFFVAEAVRRPRVISVAVPLRHGTAMAALTLVMAVPVFYAHEWLAHHKDILDVPEAVWLLVVGPLMLVVLNQLHEHVVHLADRALSRRYHRAQRCLEETSLTLQAARAPREVDRELVEGPTRGLDLASGAVFRRQAGAFRRQGGSAGWDATMMTQLDGREEAAVLRAAMKGAPIRLARGRWRRAGLPRGVARRCLAVPVRGGSGEPLAVALYGAHVTGSDLDADERAMLGALADRAGAAYERVEIETLRREVAELRAQLVAGHAPRASSPG
jgi:GAF domain-containing protein